MYCHARKLTYTNISITAHTSSNICTSHHERARPTKSMLNKSARSEFSLSVGSLSSSPLSHASLPFLVRIWDLQSGCQVGLTLQAGRPVTSIYLTAAGMISAGTVGDGALGAGPGVVRVYDSALVLMEQEIADCHSGPVPSLSWLVDGSLLASGSRDKSVRIHRPDGQCVLSLAKAHADIVRVCWSPDGSKLCSASNDIRIWSSKTFECESTAAVKAAVLSVDISLDNCIATGDSDGCLCVYDSHLHLRLSLKGSKPINSVAFCSLGERVAAGDGDRFKKGGDQGVVRVYEMRTGQVLFSVAGHSNWITQVAFLGNAFIVSSSRDCTTRIWHCCRDVSANVKEHSLELSGERFALCAPARRRGGGLEAPYVCFISRRDLLLMHVLYVKSGVVSASGAVGFFRAPSPILSLASPPYDEVEGAKIAVAVGCQSGEVHQLCAPLPSAYTSGLFEVLTLGDKE